VLCSRNLAIFTLLDASVDWLIIPHILQLVMQSSDCLGMYLTCIIECVDCLMHVLVGFDCKTNCIMKIYWMHAVLSV